MVAFPYLTRIVCGQYTPEMPRVVRQSRLPKWGRASFILDIYWRSQAQNKDGGVLESGWASIP
jgi:hypothetical protein